MSIRTDLSIDWSVSPRIIEVIKHDLIDRGNCESIISPMIFDETVPVLSNCTWIRDSAQAYEGTYSYKFTKTIAAGTVALVYLVDSVGPNDLHGCVPDKRYEFKVRMKIPSGGILGSEIRLQVYDYAGDWVATNQAAANIYDAWQEVMVTRTIRSGATAVVIAVQCLSTTELNEYFNVDAIELIDTSVTADTEVSLQDLIDTLRYLEHQPDNMGYTYIVDSFGKQPLGGGVLVGITLVLNNAKLSFEARYGLTFVQCNISGGNLVAIDENGDNMDPVQTTAYTQIVKTSSSSATLQELADIQYSSFNGGVTIDVINGVSGTVFPTGTPRQPVDNLVDAKSIAVARGFGTLFIVGNIGIEAAANVNDYSLHGQSHNHTTITFINGCSTEGTEIQDAAIEGVLAGQVDIDESTLLDITGLSGHIHNSILKGELTLAGTADVQFINCTDGLPGLGIPTVNIGSGRAVGFWNWTGGLQLQNKSGSESVSVNMISGRLILDSTVVAGTILVKGVGLIEDNSVGTIVNTEGLVPTGMWEGRLEDHQLPGTYGHELVTKADLGASVSTDYTQAGSGLVIFGTEAFGTYVSTVVRDGVYWQITEDVSDGITVELTFNLPSIDHRPGVINVYGRYSGNPKIQHFQNLYAYNYETSSWEELLDGFLPGGNTTDDDYSHEFYERHIDRENNNEVKIRFVHNPTTYNPSHNIYLDYVDVSSIKVITAAEIAATVWDELIAGHVITGSAGAVLTTIWDEAGGKRVLDKVNNQEIFYKADNVTEVMRFNLFDKNGNPSVVNVYERVRV